jgi:hypothetical protein
MFQPFQSHNLELCSDQMTKESKAVEDERLQFTLPLVPTHDIQCQTRYGIPVLCLLGLMQM